MRSTRTPLTAERIVLKHILIPQIANGIQDDQVVTECDKLHRRPHENRLRLHKNAHAQKRRNSLGNPRCEIDGREEKHPFLRKIEKEPTPLLRHRLDNQEHYKRLDKRYSEISRHSKPRLRRLGKRNRKQKMPKK